MTPARERRKRPGLRAFWREVSDGLTVQQLWGQFRREAGTSVRVYTKDLKPDAEAERSMKGSLRIARIVFWAVLRKLSPPRRALLLAALLMLVLGGIVHDYGFAIFGGLALLALLGLELADRVAMKRDLEIARDIQGWLVPQTPPETPGVDIAFTTRPANTVAGDYYDAFPLPGATGSGGTRRVALVVADVAGKGIPAALLMAAFQSSLRTLVPEELPLAELVTRLNRYSCEHSLEGRRFTTAVIAELDPGTGVLRYVNAGHNPPALRRANGGIEWLEAGGLPLGIQRDATYASGAATIGPGDQLFVYTDGVPDARNEAGDQFEQHRFAAWLATLGATTSAEALGRLIATLDAFVGDAAREDDITCLVARVTDRSAT